MKNNEFILRFKALNFMYRVYTPGYRVWPQPIPQDTTPIWYVLWPSIIINGPANWMKHTSVISILCFLQWNFTLACLHRNSLFSSQQTEMILIYNSVETIQLMTSNIWTCNFTTNIRVVPKNHQNFSFLPPESPEHESMASLPAHIMWSTIPPGAAPPYFWRHCWFVQMGTITFCSVDGCGPSNDNSDTNLEWV